jgi:Glucosyl transferase GtrII/Dolichyl-phosphate-mannose-protein mannosyltransferase
MASIRSCVLVAIIVFVGAMPLFTEHSSVPFYYHQDEPGKVLQVIHRRKNFHHPLLMLTTAEVARKTFLHGGAEDDPQRVVEMARTIMAAFAAASASLLALFATRLYGLWAGLAVGLLTVTNPLLYELAHYFKEDPAFLFGIVACALAAHHYSTRRSARSLVLLGLAAGVAAAGKYVGAALVPVAAVLGASIGGGNARERWKRAGKVVGTALLAWLVLNYRAVRSPVRFTHGLGEETGKALLGNHGMANEVPHAYYFGVQGDYGGPWVPALATLWLAFAIFRPRKISVAEWFLAGVALVAMVAFSFTPKTSTRYYLPVAVALCYLAATGAFHWAALASARWERSRIGAPVLAVLLCVGAAWGQWGDTQELRLGLQKDDRAELVRAVEALSPTAIIVQDQAAGLPEPGRLWYHRGLKPLQQKVLGAKQACDLGSLADLRARGVTHLALNGKTYGRYFTPGLVAEDQDAVMANRAFYQTALEKGRVLHEWKLGRVRHYQPGLVLVDISGLDPDGVPEVR